MKLKDIMTKDVIIVHPEDTLQAAAKKMRDYDIGFLPVYEGRELVGVLSDRDIVVRATAENRDPTTLITRDLMTSPAVCCFEDQDVEDAARVMNQNQIRRLVILKRADNDLAGVISLGDLALHVNGDVPAEVLQSVSEP